MKYPAYFPEWVMYASLYLFFGIHVLTPFFSLLYCLALNGVTANRFGRLMKLAVYAPLAVELFLVAFTWFNDGVFYYLPGREYHRGRMLVVLYAISIYYILFGLSYISISKNIITEKRRYFVFGFSLLGSAAILLQFLCPGLALENFAISICVLLVFLTIQKPEELLDGNTRVFNRNTFNEMVRRRYCNHGKFIVSILCIDDIRLLTKTIGMENLGILMKNVADFLEELNRRGVYYLETGVFALIMEDEDILLMESALRKVMERFLHPFLCGGMEINLSSKACIIRCPSEADTLDSIFEYVDHVRDIVDPRLYRKREEDSILWAEKMDLSDRNRVIAIEQLLRKAVREKAFEVYYQPIYSVTEKRYLSAEALVRLRDREMGDFSPEEFIPVAEQNGLVLAIGMQVFEAVCRFIQKERLKEKGIRYVEVNLSVVQCMQENLAGELLTIMNRYRLEPGQIRLEITETAALNSPKILHKNVDRLYRRGVRFALDDFGTGYSNINSLAELPLELIKLDKTMVWGAYANEKSKIVLESSIAMIKKMNMLIVAEGVETGEQAEDLTRLGCDFLQGYYFSRPVPEEAFLDLLEKQ